MPKTKLKEKTKTFRIVPFPQVLTVVVTDDMQASFDKRRNKVGGHTVPSTSLACTWTSNHSMQMFMFLPSKLGPSVIVHESVHVLAHVMEHNGVTFEQEVWAYHMDELFDQIAPFVYKTNPLAKSRNK